MYYTYLLQSEKDRKTYIGSTNDLKNRILEHNSGKVFSTKSRLPVNLIYYEAYLDEKAARLREKRLKYFGQAYQELKKRIGIV